jgi:hypothetical protein
LNKNFFRAFDFMKRGPKQGDKADRTRARVKKWQARFLAALAKAPSVSHAAKAPGVHRSTCYAVRDSDPHFAKAWEQSLETAVDGLVVAAFRRALGGSDTLLTFLLRCHRPATYNISHAENVSEQPDDKSFSVNILYQTEKKHLKDLLDFPLETDSPEVARQKQARLMGNTPATAEEAPPPKVVPKHLTGRIRPEWKGNGK